jgi:hypothetical protein
VESEEQSGEESNNIKVFVRVRPLGGGSGVVAEETRCAAVTGARTITLNSKENKVRVARACLSVSPNGTSKQAG